MDDQAFEARLRRRGVIGVLLALVGTVIAMLGAAASFTLQITIGTLLAGIGVVLWAGARGPGIDDPSYDRRAISLVAVAGVLLAGSLFLMAQFDVFVDTIESPAVVDKGEVLDEATTEIHCDDQETLAIIGPTMALGALWLAAAALLATSTPRVRRWALLPIAIAVGVSVLWLLWDSSQGCFV